MKDIKTYKKQHRGKHVFLLFVFLIFLITCVFVFGMQSIFSSKHFRFVSLAPSPLSKISPSEHIIPSVIPTIDYYATDKKSLTSNDPDNIYYFSYENGSIVGQADSVIQAVTKDSVESVASWTLSRMHQGGGFTKIQKIISSDPVGIKIIATSDTSYWRITTFQDRENPNYNSIVIARCPKDHPDVQGIDWGCRDGVAFFSHWEVVP